MNSKGIYYPESPGLPVSQFNISPSLGNHETDFCTKVEEPISPLQHQHIISISNEEIIPDKKKVLTRTEREIIAERKAIDQRRKIICSQHEQTRIQRINNQRWNHLNKNLFSPQLKIDRKIFSLSPTSVLIRGYNSNINLEKNNEQNILRKNRKKRERNIFSPSSGYKRVYKSMTHEFQPPRTANCWRPKRLFSKNWNNYENSTKDVTLISI